MMVLDPGHTYKLNWLDGYPEVAGIGSRPHSSMSEDTLIFVKREGEGYPGNVGHHAGTNIQEVLRALIDRVKYLNNQIPDAANIEAVFHLRQTLYFMEKRAAQRHGRNHGQLIVEFNRIETLPTCAKCGHIGCAGECHPKETE